LSHYDIWQKIKKPTLILEDDIMVHEETFTQLKSVFDNLNQLNATNNWDILYVAGQWTPRYDFNSKPYMDSHQLLDQQKNVLFEHVGSTFYKRNYISEKFNNDLFYTPLYRTTAGYIISPSGANKLCSIIDNLPEDFMNEPLDMWLLKLEKNKLINMIDSFPHPMYQGGFDLMKEECLLKTDIDRSKKILFHLNHDGNENVLDKFEFIEGRDIIGNDLYYKKREHVIQLLNEALNNQHCVAVNTLGFFKKDIGELKPSHYFSSNDGIYIKKSYYSAQFSNNKPIIRVKFIGNFWDTSKELIEEFKLMIPNNLDIFENIQITDEDYDIDYYVIINMPKDEFTYYDPKKTFVFSMEPDVMKETWGKWRHPNPNDFLYVHDKLNPVQWRFINKNDTNKNYNKVACILSHKKYFIGQKKRIDFVHVLENGECENIIDVFGKENYHNFRSYKGVVPNDNTSNVLNQYKYYFMCENNEQLDYATEKIWEPIICECLCFYWGCPNLSEYIDSRAYVALDLNDMERSKSIVKKAIQEDWWSQRLPFIRAEKQKIITNLGFFPTLKNIIESKRYHATLQEFSHNSDSNNSNAVYYSQDKQDYFLENNVFKGFKSGIYVDVGAHDGVTINNTLYFHKNNKWNGINIEPIKSVYDKLLINRPNDKNINCAICNYDGKTEFICNNGYTEMISGIKETYDKRHYNRLDNENKLMNASTEIIIVDTKKLETIFNENNISRVHYLSIDVEGGEFEVIKSINFDNVFIDVIGFENNYNDASIPIIEYLQSKKYVVINNSIDIFMIHERSMFYNNLNYTDRIEK
jgi:FkbM family methyltransferase